MTDCSAPWSWYINALIIRLLCKVSKAWHVRTIKILVQVQICCTKRDEIRATNLNIIHRYHVGEQLDALITWWMFYAFKIPNTICTNWTAWRLTISPHGFESDQRHVVLPWAPTQWKLITLVLPMPLAFLVHVIDPSTEIHLMPTRQLEISLWGLMTSDGYSSFSFVDHCK